MKLRELDILEADILKEDPVRPHISKAERLSDGRQVFVLENKDKISIENKRVDSRTGPHM